MKLTQEQLQDLKNLKNSPGYAVLLMIEDEARKNLGDLLLKSDLEDSKQIEIIKKNQIYQKARDDLLNNIERHTREIYEPKVS